MKDLEYTTCPVCNGNPRRWFSYDECIKMCVRYPSYEDCDNCEDGYILEDEEDEEKET